MTAVDRLSGTTVRRRPYPGPQEAVVHSTADGRLFVRLAGTGQRYIHGPVEAAEPLPTVGARCLVVQSDAGRWWLLAALPPP